MKFQEAVDTTTTWLYRHHVWTVPIGILLVSHLIFGVLSGLPSGALSVIALRYHAKHKHE